MKKLEFDHQFYLSAFMRTAQYMAGLTSQEDAWQHLSEIMVTFFQADSSCFARRLSGTTVDYCNCVTKNETFKGLLLTQEVRRASAEVLDSGFLESKTMSHPEPYSLVFLPVGIGNQTAAAMLVGHAAPGPVSNELLNVYLAVAGLAGTTITKLISESELKVHRARLEELVSERTSRLNDTLSRLELEIEEHRAAEEALKQYRDHLEEQVGERTAELASANEELKKYSAKLERINEELREFTFVASHDLQEPLRKIQTFGDRLRGRLCNRLDENEKDYLDRMINSAGRMSALLKSLLSYSQLTNVESRFNTVDLSRSAREAVSDLELLIEEGTEIEIEDLPVIDGDPNQIRILFQNLIGNSLKYCRQCEKPSVRLYGCTEGDTCRIYVEDNGIGFEEIYLDRIFRPFQRLHARNVYEGTGMGLSICRKIAEHHAGSITARSKPGKGSVFIVTLPVRRACEPT